MRPRYLLDSAVLVAAMKGRPGAVRLVQSWIAGQQAATSILACGEAIEYVKGQGEYLRNRATLRILLREVESLPLSEAVFERYADLRRAMRKPHGTGLIGDVGTLIAATAIEHRLTMVTLDGDFTRVPGLSVMLLDRAAIV